MIDVSRRTHQWLRGVTLATTVLAAGCAPTASSIMGSGTGVTASDPTRLTQSGFLSDYGRLRTVSWAEGIQCWRDPGLDAKKYDKVLIGRMTVKLKPGQEARCLPGPQKGTLARAGG